jgi:hypothetical protein
MNNGRPSWFSIACAFAVVAMSFAGCKRAAPWHDYGCGAAYQHDPIYWEHPFYGYHATCWQQWPPGWVGCPTDCLGPHGGADWDAVPPGTEAIPPGAAPLPGPMGPGGPMPDPAEAMRLEIPPSSAPAPDMSPPTLGPSSRAPAINRSAEVSPPKDGGGSSVHLIGVPKNAGRPAALTQTSSRPDPAGVAPQSLADVLASPAQNGQPHDRIDLARARDLMRRTALH